MTSWSRILLFSSLAVVFLQTHTHTEERNKMPQRKLLWPLLLLWPGYDKVSVLVTSSCHNKTPHTRWLKHQKWAPPTPQILEAGNLRSRSQLVWLTPEVSLRGLWVAAFVLCAFVLWHGLFSHGVTEMLAVFSFYEGHQSYRKRAPPWWPHLTWITSLKALSPNIVTLKVKASTYHFGGKTWLSL